MKRVLVLVLVLVLAAFGAFAATGTGSHTVTMNVNAIAAIAVVGGNITMAVAPPATPGAQPADATDSTTKLAYTVVGAGVVTVQWGATDGSPAGTQLQVVAGSVAGYGTAASTVTISSTAQNLITSIPSCYTTAAGVPVLQYTLHVQTPGSLVSSATKTATITYTMTAN